jgi:hypothetical protein
MSHEIPSKCFCEEAQPRKNRQVSEERWWLRFVLFTFGAFPQTINLLAMRGVLWIQLAGTSYVASYLITEAIDKFAGEHDLKDRFPIPLTYGELLRLVSGPEILEGRVLVPDNEKDCLQICGAQEPQ